MFDIAELYYFDTALLIVAIYICFNFKSEMSEMPSLKGISQRGRYSFKWRQALRERLSHHMSINQVRNNIWQWQWQYVKINEFLSICSVFVYLFFFKKRKKVYNRKKFTWDSWSDALHCYYFSVTLYSTLHTQFERYDPSEQHSSNMYIFNLYGFSNI